MRHHKISKFTCGWWHCYTNRTISMDRSTWIPFAERNNKWASVLLCRITDNKSACSLISTLLKPVFEIRSIGRIRFIRTAESMGFCGWMDKSSRKLCVRNNIEWHRNCKTSTTSTDQWCEHTHFTPHFFTIELKWLIFIDIFRSHSSNMLAIVWSFAFGWFHWVFSNRRGLGLYLVPWASI